MRLNAPEPNHPSANSPAFIQASTLHQQHHHVQRICTGIPELDRLLHGGIELGLFTLFYGDSRFQKLLLELAVITQLPPNHGGVNRSVIFIDAENIFNPFEVMAIARHHKWGSDEVLRRIHVVRAFSHPMLVDALINLLPPKMQTFVRPDTHEALSTRIPASLVPGLIVVSGLGAHCASALEDNAVSHPVSHAIWILKSLAMQYQVAIVASGPIAKHSRWKPAGGTVLQHTAQVHIRLDKYPGRTEYTLCKHPSFAQKKAVQWSGSPLMVNATLDLYMDSPGGP